jgi:hypothetical protein
MQGRFIRKGGVFNAQSAPAEFYGAPVTKIGSRPITGPNFGPRRRVGFRRIGPFGQPPEFDPTVPVPTWVKRGDDRAPYWRDPHPMHCEGNACIETAAWYGREAGNFFNSPRRCPVEYGSPTFNQWGEFSVTPRGGIFDGATIGAPSCTYGVPQPPTIPQLMPAQHEVPPDGAPGHDIPFAPPFTPGPFSGVGPDGIG